MTAALAPSRTVGIAGTTLAHGALILAVLLAARHHTSSRLVYEVNLVAAPMPATGPAKPIANAPPAPKAAAPVIKPKPKPKAPPKKVPVQTKAAAPAPAMKNPVTPLPGVTPSTGQDVVTLHQGGTPFPYPEYLSRIENEILRRWDQSGFRAGLHASVAFVINRDGTVPDSSIVVDTHSGYQIFDDRATAAIESASAAKAFGPLPSGFNSASLPILFNFTMTPKGGP